MDVLKGSVREWFAYLDYYFHPLEIFFFHMDDFHQRFSPTIFIAHLDKPKEGIYDIGEEFRAQAYIDSTPALPKIYYNLFFLHYLSQHYKPTLFFDNTIHEVIQSRNQEENS